VIVTDISMLERRIRGALPALAAEFEPLRARVGTPGEDQTARVVYGQLATTDFSSRVLQPHTEGLAVLPVTGIGWNDLGEPSRVLATQHALGTRGLAYAAGPTAVRALTFDGSAVFDPRPIASHFME
jgi:hypothetical protein